MNPKQDKGTEISASAKRPYVLLVKDPSRAALAGPVDLEWVSKLTTFGSASNWVAKGGVLGLALHQTRTVSCLSIKKDSAHAISIAYEYGLKGCLVCSAFDRYYIFLKRPESPLRAGRYLLSCGGASAEVEWHPGGPGDVWYAPLPVGGSPKDWLGEHVYMAVGKVLSRPCSLEELERWLASLPALSLPLRPIDPGSEPEPAPSLVPPTSDAPPPPDTSSQAFEPSAEELFSSYDAPPSPPSSREELPPSGQTLSIPKPPPRVYERYQYVRLAKDVDPTRHKRPIDPDWPNKELTKQEVNLWLFSGGGLGLALHRLQFTSCIDIDTDNESARKIAQWYGRLGGLVCKSLRGFHIFIRRPAEAPLPGRYWLEIEEDGRSYGVEVEWHPGGAGDVRQIVLPIDGTPRARLGGGVFMAGGQVVGRACGLGDLEIWIATLPEVPLTLRPMESAARRAPVLASPNVGSGAAQAGHSSGIPQPTPQGGVAGEGEASFAQRTWGGIPSLSAFREWALGLKEGERHTLLTRAAASLASLGALEHLFELYLLAGEIFRGEKTAADEMRKICVSAVQKFGTNGMTKLGSTEAPKRQRGRPSVDSKIEEILGYLRERGCLKYTDGDGERYLLVGSVALSVSNFWNYLSANGITVSEKTAEAAFERAFSVFEFAQDVSIMGPKPIWHAGKLYAKFLCGKRVVVYRADASGVTLIENPSDEGIYLIWGDHSGREYYENLTERDLRKVLNSIERFTQMEDGRVALSLLAPIALGQATGIIVAQGPSGSGKSTLSKLIQGIADGANSVIMGMGEDVRDWRVNARRKNVLGLDEAAPSKELEDFLKIMVSGGNYTVRKLYTNSEASVISVRASAILSSITIEKLAADTARRTIVLDLKRYGGDKKRRDINEDRFAALLSKYADKMFCVLFHLVPQVLQALESHKGTEEEADDFFTIPENSLYPEWADTDSKRDWALATWAWSFVLGVSDQIEAVWKKVRGEARIKGLGYWGEVIRLMETDPTFAQQMQEGMTYGSIAQRLALEAEDGSGEAESVRSVAEKLRRTSKQVQTALYEEGWISEIYKSRINGHERWVVKLQRATSTRSQTPPEEETPF